MIIRHPQEIEADHQLRWNPLLPNTSYVGAAALRSLLQRNEQEKGHGSGKGELG